MKGKILLITYTFFPEQNPRAFRWESLVRVFLRLGYEVDVLMPKHKDVIRKSEMAGLRYYETKRYLFYDFVYKHILRKTEGSMVLGKRANHFQTNNTIKKILIFLTRTFLWSDNSSLWFFPARKSLKEIIKKNKYDCIISSSPAFVSHLLGYYAKKRMKDVKWIGEYGDPYSFNPARAKSIFNFINKPVERKILKQMNYIVVPVAKSKAGFLKHFPFLDGEKIKVISQSLDYIMPNSGNIDWSYFDPSLVNIAYTGLLYPDIRNPETLFESLLMLKKDNIESYKKLRFHFFGRYDNVENTFRKYKELLDDKSVILYGSVLRENCSFACQKADFLLNISNISSYQVPSKLIEYLLYKKPIISLDNKEDTEPSWPFLVKVDYKISSTVNFLKVLSVNKVMFSFNDYDNIVKRYDIGKITEQYINLISHNVGKSPDSQK